MAEEPIGKHRQVIDFQVSAGRLRALLAPFVGEPDYQMLYFELDPNEGTIRIAKVIKAPEQTPVERAEAQPRRRAQQGGTR